MFKKWKISFLGIFFKLYFFNFYEKKNIKKSKNKNRKTGFLFILIKQ